MKKEIKQTYTENSKQDKRLFATYLEENGVVDFDEISIIEIRKLFYFIRAKFLDSNINPSTFSMFCGLLLDKLLNFDLEDEEEDLEGALIDGIELECYKKPTTKKKYLLHLENIKAFPHQKYIEDAKQDKRLFATYLEENGVVDFDEIKEEDVKKLFIFIRDKFAREKIGVSTFSVFCGILWQKLINLDRLNQSLMGILNIGMDLDFYEKQDKKIYHEWLKDIKTYH
jgi:L-rhamnose isomerase